ncbi:tyrosine-protein phosphatase [Paenibacillus sp. GbtcB18]|uniref:tyrosine-protein phosphatase n=1 Tax=Paenibacillus sp. GbtcB18 TaxID=2824763 RepID=UPI001C3096DC|nr:CpsB/CapC family capsule biosynthesis tyrosine phosphatase [Paenibacillus sp. GbtcB18]
MIDIHTHILHGLDDGPGSLEQSLEMARMAVSNGISTVFATPHHRTSRYFTPSADIKEAVAGLNASLLEHGIPLHVKSGQEIRVTPNLINDWYEDTLLTLGGTRYLLIECPAHSLPAELAEICHECSVLGLVPVIAHPERNAEVAGDPDKLLQLAEWGAAFQLTSDSILGTFGSKVQSLAFELCSRRLIHLVASDAHDLIRRPFRLSEAYEKIEAKIGGDYAEYCRRNAIRVANDLPLEKREPVAGRPRRIFAMFR